MNLSNTIIPAALFSFAVAGVWLAGAQRAGAVETPTHLSANPTPQQSASTKDNPAKPPKKPGRIKVPTKLPHPALNPYFQCNMQQKSCIANGGNGCAAGDQGCIQQICAIVKSDCLQRSGARR
jgi:hypothetical protein